MRLSVDERLESAGNGVRGEGGTPSAAAHSGADAGLARTLEEIVAQLRRLVEVDACAFLVVDWARGLIEPAAAWFADDDLAAAIAPVLGRPYERERPGVTEAAIEGGRPLLITGREWAGAESVRDRLLRDLPPEAAERTWRWYSRASLISCPVRTSDGRTLGVLAISSSPPLRPLDAESLRVVEIFADLAAVALDRAELLEREERRAREEQMMSRAAARVAESLVTEDVYERIVEQAGVVTGAEKVVLTRYLPQLGELEFVAHRGLVEDVSGRRVRLGEGMLGRVAESRTPYVSREEDREHFMTWFVEQEAVRSFMHAPIELGPRLFGVLSVADRRADLFGPDALEPLCALATASAAALANAVDYEHERRVARALTRGFVPGRLDPATGLDVGLLYEPAEREAAGGDIYGAWPTHRGEVAVVIGDVAGKGLEVAALAAMVRFFIEARTWDSTSPAEVLSLVNAALARRLPEDAFATVFLAFIEARSMRWANAGHAPPMVVRADRSVEDLRALTVPLGIKDPEPYEEQVTPFGSGDLLFAYTDGLAEARRDGVLFAEAGLEQAVAEAARTCGPQAFVEAVYGRARGWAERMDDDVALLALRRRGDR